METVQEILHQYLPDHEITYCEEEDNQICGVNFKNAGIAVTLRCGLEVFGSSSNLKASPLPFAAYELLERFAIISLPKETHPLESKDFKLSISNGIAIHDNFEDARESAYFELLERNEILKSWYFNTPIKELNLDLLPEVTNELKAQYDLRLIDFSTVPNTSVVGVFAFPKQPGVNLVYGFGGRRTVAEAAQKAWKEFITRLGFLWGEGPSVDEFPVNTPDYHQDFYLKPENTAYILEWISGEGRVKKECQMYQLKDTYYVNITPQGWESRFSVIKARSTDAIPLFFGQPPKQFFDFPFRCDIPHPMM